MDATRETGGLRACGSEAFGAAQPSGAEGGTRIRIERLRFMSEHLSHLMEYAVQIAWNYLEQTGQIDDGAFTSRFLMTTVEDMIRKGERRRLLLSNRAITAYERLLKNRSFQPPAAACAILNSE
jgi:hypothetical protein